MAYPGNQQGGSNPSDSPYPYQQPGQEQYQPPAQAAPTHDSGNFGSYSVEPPNSAPPGMGQQPAYGPTPPAGPVSSPTQYMPTAQPPMSGPPVSPAYGAPLSGPPMSGVPMSGVPMSGPGMYQAPPPAPKKSPVVPILASALALFVIVAAVFIGLYVDKSGKLSDEQRTRAARDTTISERDNEVKTLKADLQTKTDELTKAEQSLRGSQGQNEQVTKERDTIAKCLQLLLEALQLANTGPRSALDAKLAELEKPCDDADRYLS